MSNKAELYIVLNFDCAVYEVYADDIKFMNNMICFYKDGILDSAYSIRNIIGFERVNKEDWCNEMENDS